MALCVKNDDYESRYDFFSDDYEEKDCGELGLSDAEIVQLFFMFVTVYITIDGLGWPPYQQELLLEKPKSELMSTIPDFERKGTVSKLFGFVRIDRFINNCILNMNCFLSTISILLLLFDNRMGFPALFDHSEFKLTLSVQYSSRLIPHMLIIAFTYIQYQAERGVRWNYQIHQPLYTIERYMDIFCVVFGMGTLLFPLGMLSAPLIPTILITIGCYAAAFFVTIVIFIMGHGCFTCIAGIPMSYMNRTTDNLKIEIVFTKLVNNVHYLFLLLMCPIPIAVFLADLAGEFLSEYNCGSMIEYCIIPSDANHSFDQISSLQFILTLLMQIVALTIYYLGTFSMKNQIYIPLVSSFHGICQADGLLRSINEQDFVMRYHLKSRSYDYQPPFPQTGHFELTPVMVNEGLCCNTADEFQRFVRARDEELYDQWATLRFQYDSIRETRSLLREGVPLIQKSSL
eukprot:TRINITY_DN11602_c0_g2_i1.p1 TRINITY_DN11602_c0_g2~~TRINITY_DN11602_c0_g2_i1.p1  ORF type:complete len:458 (-),score=85.38 TRINITY_DN11602_c0_g2_i1:243-1616(-)